MLLYTPRLSSCEGLLGSVLRRLNWTECYLNDAPENQPDSRPECISCGYLLHGLTRQVCPECGQPFDEKDPRTFRVRGTESGSLEWAMPPSKFEVAIPPFFAGIYIFGNSFPGGAMEWLGFEAIGVFVIGVMLLGYAVFRFAGRISDIRSHRDLIARGLRLPENRRRWRWFVLPVCLGIFLSVCLTDWPLRSRFEMSRAAFEQVLSQTTPSDVEISVNRRIGFYGVRSIRLDPSGHAIIQTGMSRFKSVGFCFRPKHGPIPSHLKFTPNWFAKQF